MVGIDGANYGGNAETCQSQGAGAVAWRAVVYPMRRRPDTWLVALSLLGGCISVSELHQSSPTHVADVQGRYLTLATCVVELAQTESASQGVSYKVEDIATAKTARVVAIARYPGGLFYAVPTPLLELTFRELDDTIVKVEARRGPLGSALDLTVRPIIDRCAQPDRQARPGA